DHRQGRQRAAAELVGELARALEQPRVQVEDVAGERLAARRPAQQQRQLPVRVRVLRQVVVDAERVAAVVEEVLAHRGAGERRHPLDRRRLLGGRGDDDRVLQGARLAQALVHLRHGGGLLTDCDVDADHVAAALVDDRVDADRGLARAAVADDELALAAPDRDHRVDRLETGLQRLLHRLPLHDARRLELERPVGVGLDRPLPVERVAERVDDTAEQPVADRHRHHLPGAADRLALLDVLPFAEERGTDVVLLEVERDADDAVLELEPLERYAVLEPVHARDAVTDLEHGADLGEVGLHVVLLDPLLEDRGDLFGAQLHAGTSWRRGLAEEPGVPPRRVRCSRIEVISSGRSFKASPSSRYLVTSSRRSRSSRPRTLASTRSEPAWRIMPPINEGSTVRVASTVRPDARSIFSTIERASSSESAFAVVSSTTMRPRARSRKRRSSSYTCAISPARPFSASSRSVLRTSSSPPSLSCASRSALAAGSTWGLERKAASSGDSSSACTNAPRSRSTASRRPSSSAASKSAFA